MTAKRTIPATGVNAVSLTRKSSTRCRMCRSSFMGASPLSCVTLALAAAAAVAGCAVGPNFHKPAAPAGAGYATEPLPQATASTDTLGGDAQLFITGQDLPFEWWQAFGSPALDSLVEKAFRANPNIKA